MIRSVIFKRIVTYTITKDEVVRAMIAGCRGDDDLALLPNPIEIEGIAETVVVSYRYDYDPPAKESGEAAP